MSGIMPTVDQSDADSSIKCVEGKPQTSQTAVARKRSQPKVSVGLPVYNGERYLREAIESILTQDFTDFELLIGDNASTDCTWDICQEYAARYQRIRLHRHERNVGATANFEFVFENTTGPYFMWHAHDDFRAPSSVKECVQFLDSNRNHVLCSTGNSAIDERGRSPLYSLPYDFVWDDDRPENRFRKCLNTYGQYHALYGLIRREALEQLLPFPRLEWHADTIFVLQMCLVGKCGQVKETLRHFSVRKFYTVLEALNQYTKDSFGPGFKVKLFPNTRACRVLISQILHFHGLSLSQKLVLIGLALRHGPLSNFLTADIELFFKKILLPWETAYSLCRALKRWVSRLLYSQAR